MMMMMMMNNNNNKLSCRNAQLTEDCHKGARGNYSETVYNRAVFNIIVYRV